MTQVPRNSYDAVPYESRAFRGSHPDVLAVMATLCGMQPAPATQCRVLELGCASGGNLIPLAAQFPHSSFTGVGLSEAQIAEGNALIAALKLGNIRLLQQSVLEVEEAEYDYIVCHGVYSWVPDPVKETILAICARRLAPQGVAYVSYNTYPGWHFRGMIRDMMIYHTRNLAEPNAKVAQSRALLDFLSQGASAETAYGKLLQVETNTLRQCDDAYLLHEYLEESNQPLYFHEFAERAAAKGLRYLGESSLSVMMTSNFPPQVRETLQQLAGDIVRTEQYIDFLRNRTFRQTLLCRGDVALARMLDPNAMARFLIGSSAKSLGAEISHADGSRRVERFTTPAGACITPGHPLIMAAFHCLAEAWPQTIGLEALLAQAVRRAGLPQDAGDAADYRAILCADMVNALAAGVIELQLTRLDFVTSVSDRPVASELARLQAAKGPLVTSQRHEPQRLDDLTRHLIQFLDGTHDRAALLKEVSALEAGGVLRVRQQDGQPYPDDAALRAALSGAIDRGLAGFAKAALLVG
jgi:methyltransferase-like protein/SAM-dependent methyltransferase